MDQVIYNIIKISIDFYTYFTQALTSLIFCLL